MTANVVVIMADQMKATASHLYGNPFCRTPSLERLSDAGVRFENAFTPHPLCVPARTSLWSGRYPHSHGSRRNETLMDPSVDHAWNVWNEAGFTTALIGKNHCFAPPEQGAIFDVACEVGHMGVDGLPPARGLEWYRDSAGVREAHRFRNDMPPISPRFTYAVTDAPEEDCSTGLIAGQAVRFLEQRGREQPFALWVSFPDPHEPYVAPRRYADLFPPESVVLPPTRDGEFDAAPLRNQVLHRMLGTENDSEQDVRAAIGIYHANVRFVDDAVGQILDALDRLGLTEDTIVVFCADHGEFAGEHGMFSKGGLFYDCLVRIPLIVSYPAAVASGRVDTSMVSLVDVVPTILQLQELRPLALAHGSALPTVVADAVPRTAAFSEYGAGGPPVPPEEVARLTSLEGYGALIGTLRPREAEGRRKMVRTARWKYVHDPTGDLDELYDLQADPAELWNLIGRPGHDAVVAELRQLLLEWSIATEDGRPVPLP